MASRRLIGQVQTESLEARVEADPSVPKDLDADLLDRTPAIIAACEGVRKLLQLDRAEKPAPLNIKWVDGFDDSTKAAEVATLDAKQGVTIRTSVDRNALGGLAAHECVHREEGKQWWDGTEQGLSWLKKAPRVLLRALKTPLGATEGMADWLKYVHVVSTKAVSGQPPGELARVGGMRLLDRPPQ